jgi:hypothetical protein
MIREKTALTGARREAGLLKLALRTQETPAGSSRMCPVKPW